MNWGWVLIIGAILIFLLLGIILYVIYRNRQVRRVVQNRVIANQRVTPSNTINAENPISVSSSTQRDPIEQTDNRAYRVIGARDGSWFQVLDRQGEIIASFSVPEGEPTFEAECPNGEVELIGIRSTADGNRIGPIGCATTASNGSRNIQYVGQQGNIERIYSLNESPPEGDCPSGFRRLMTSDGITGLLNGNIAERTATGIKYICIPDTQECNFHNDCPDGQICSGGNCIPPEEVANF